MNILPRLRRLLSLGFPVKTVRADSAYMTPGNLLFLKKLSPGYALGAPATFRAVKDGREFFRKPARKKSSRIVRASKGVAIPDPGQVTMTNGVPTRIIVIRRTNRQKKDGRWQRNTCYYAVASNLGFSARSLCYFCHKRQCTGAGFGDLKNHCGPERLPFQGLKANEFRIMSKIMAMTLFKIFQEEMLPESLRPC